MLLYRSILKAYDKGNNYDMSKFNNDKSRLKAINMMQKNRIVFASSRAFLIMV